MILFFGPPGSGKSAQGRTLVSRNGWRWLSTGELLRASDDQEIHELLGNGELVNDSLVNEVVEQALNAIQPSITVVLDGYPRTLSQVAWLTRYLADHHHAIECIIVFQLSEDEIKRRLQGRGRSEDAPAIIERRMAIYEASTRPVIEHYRSEGVAILEIDAVGTVEEVNDRIQKAIAPWLKAA